MFGRRQRRSLENPAIPLSDPAILAMFGVQASSAGVAVTEQTALTHMAVWRAISLNSGVISTLPLKIYRDTPQGRTEVKNPLFTDPSYPDVTWQEFIETLLVNLLLSGDGYALKVKNEGGSQILRVLSIASDRVTLRMGDKTELNPSGKYFKVSGVEEEFTPNEIMHIPGMSRDGLKGLSPIAHAAQAIGIGLAAEDVAGRIFNSGLMNAGIIQADADLNDEQVQQVKQRWREVTAQSVKNLEIAVLSAGMHYTPTTIPPKDAQFLETRQFSVQDVARLYGVPADLLMDNSATGNTAVEQRALAWVKFGLRPFISRLERRFSMHLLPRGQFCEFELDGLLRGDSKTQAEVMAIMISTGLLTVDEGRAILNRPPLPKAVPAPVATAPVEPEGEEFVDEEEGDDA